MPQIRSVVKWAVYAAQNILIPSSVFRPIKFPCRLRAAFVLAYKGAGTAPVLRAFRPAVFISVRQMVRGGGNQIVKMRTECKKTTSRFRLVVLLTYGVLSPLIARPRPEGSQTRNFALTKKHFPLFALQIRESAFVLLTMRLLSQRIRSTPNSEKIIRQPSLFQHYALIGAQRVGGVGVVTQQFLGIGPAYGQGLGNFPLPQVAENQQLRLAVVPAIG